MFGFFKKEKQRFAQIQTTMAAEDTAIKAASEDNIKNANDLYDRLMSKKSFYEDHYILINEAEWKIFVSRFLYYRDLTWSDKHKIQGVPSFINILGQPIESVHSYCQVRSMLETLMSLSLYGDNPDPILDTLKERVRLNKQMIECTITLLESPKTIYVSKQGLTIDNYDTRVDVFIADYSNNITKGRVFGCSYGSVEIKERWNECDTLGFYKKADHCLQWMKECEERGKELIK